MIKRYYGVWLFALFSASAGAQPLSGGSFVLHPQTMDSGGGQSSGGVFELHSTIGQPDAGPLISGGSFQLHGGFWGPIIDDNTDPAILIDSFE